MLKKIFQVQNIQIKSITGIIKDLSHANKLQSLQDFHFLSNSISQQPIKQHNSQINDPWSFFWSKTSCEFNISLNLRLFSKKKKKTFLCLALSSLVTLAFSFMVVRTKIRSERLRGREREKEGEEPGGQNGLFTRAFLSLPLSLVGALINMRAERKKERKKKWKERKEREIEKPQQNRTKHNLLCSSSSWLFFYIIYIYLFINYKLKIFFFFDVFCCCCCLFLFLPIFSLGFGVRTCVPVGGVFGAWWPFLIFGTCGRLGFEMEGSTLAQCALGPLPFLSRHVSSNFCTIQRLNYTLMCSKIWGYQPKKKKKKCNKIWFIISKFLINNTSPSQKMKIN